MIYNCTAEFEYAIDESECEITILNICTTVYMLNLFDKKIYICLENIYRLYFQLDEHFNIVKYRFLEKFCINMHSYVFKNSIKKKETRKLMFVQFFFFFVREFYDGLATITLVTRG